MRVFVLGSGSSGNCVVVEAEGERIVLDAGLGPKAFAAALRALGADLFPPEAQGALGTSERRAAVGIVITHEHGDHIGKLQPLARALKAPVFLHRGIEAPRARRRFEVQEYAPGGTLRCGPFEIQALAIPHDATQMALRVRAGGRVFGLATDLGHAPPEVAAFLGACDVALVEANYCPALLEDGPYPPHLKRRVRGPLGHLGNEQTAELAHRLADSRLGCLVIGHLSQVNNSPARALEVVRARAGGLPVEVVPHGVPRSFEVAPTWRPWAAAQLSLPGFDLRPA